MIEYIKVPHINSNLTVYVSINQLIKYTTQSKHYKEYLERFLKLRRTITVIEKVNHFMPNNKFILALGKYICLSEMKPNEILKLAFDKQPLGLYNKKIILFSYISS
jgi:hypothetical protein